MSGNHVHIVSAAIVRADTCLVAQRGPQMSYTGRWELPGGKVEPGEGPREALRREIREELDMDVFVGPKIASARSKPGLRDFRVEVYRATARRDTLHLHEHAQYRWIGAEELESLEWTEPHLPIIPALRSCLSGPTGDPLLRWLGAPLGPARAATAWSAAASASWAVACHLAWGSWLLSSLAARQAVLGSSR